MHPDSGISKHELGLELATVLPDRNTLGIVVNASPEITVAPVIGVAVATQVLTAHSSNAAWVTQFFHG